MTSETHPFKTGINLPDFSSPKLSTFDLQTKAMSNDVSKLCEMKRDLFSESIIGSSVADTMLDFDRATFENAMNFVKRVGLKNLKPIKPTEEEAGDDFLIPGKTQKSSNNLSFTSRKHKLSLPQATYQGQEKMDIEEAN